MPYTACLDCDRAKLARHTTPISNANRGGVTPKVNPRHPNAAKNSPEDGQRDVKELSVK